MMIPTIDAKMIDPERPIDVLSGLIAKRAKYLKGETTETATIATAINVLSSLRARTKVAKPSAAKRGFQLTEDAGISAGFKNHRRVVRSGGHTVDSAKVVSIVGNYTKGERTKVFRIVFKNERFWGRYKGTCYDRVYLIARSKGEAEKWAKERLAKYIKQYAGMVKWAIGQAQGKIGTSVAYSLNSNKSRTRAMEHSFIKQMGSGWNSGSFTISYLNDLDYASLALKGGEADVDLALMKAANRTAAIINKLGDIDLRDRIETPFPEVKDAKR